MNESDHLRCLTPLFWATHSVRSAVHLATSGSERAGFDSEEGVQQGSGPASTGFCAGIHPEVQALDFELSAQGGAARFIMDDGYAVGPPELVFEAVRHRKLHPSDWNYRRARANVIVLRAQKQSQHTGPLHSPLAHAETEQGCPCNQSDTAFKLVESLWVIQRLSSIS